MHISFRLIPEVGTSEGHPGLTADRARDRNVARCQNIGVRPFTPREANENGIRFHSICIGPRSFPEGAIAVSVSIGHLS